MLLYFLLSIIVTWSIISITSTEQFAKLICLLEPMKWLLLIVKLDVTVLDLCLICMCTHSKFASLFIRSWFNCADFVLQYSIALLQNWPRSNRNYWLIFGDERLSFYSKYRSVHTTDSLYLTKIRCVTHKWNYISFLEITVYWNVPYM